MNLNKHEYLVTLKVKVTMLSLDDVDFQPTAENVLSEVKNCAFRDLQFPTEVELEEVEYLGAVE